MRKHRRESYISTKEHEKTHSISLVQGGGQFVPLSLKAADLNLELVLDAAKVTAGRLQVTVLSW